MGKDCSEGKGHGVYQNHNQLKGQWHKKCQPVGFQKGYGYSNSEHQPTHHSYR